MSNNVSSKEDNEERRGAAAAGFVSPASRQAQLDREEAGRMLERIPRLVRRLSYLESAEATRRNRRRQADDVRLELRRDVERLLGDLRSIESRRRGEPTSPRGRQLRITDYSFKALARTLDAADARLSKLHRELQAREVELRDLGRTKTLREHLEREARTKSDAKSLAADWDRPSPRESSRPRTSRRKP